MKTIARTALYLQVPALLLVRSLTGFAAPESEKAVHGTIQAIETYEPHFPALSIEASGSGQASHLGAFTMTADSEVNLLDGSGLGYATFERANGDSLFLTGTGQFTSTGDPEIALVTETLAITGGTGQFAGATGSFTVERVLNPLTGVTCGSFQGAIVFQKREHEGK